MYYKIILFEYVVNNNISITFFFLKSKQALRKIFMRGPSKVYITNFVIGIFVLSLSETC